MPCDPERYFFMNITRKDCKIKTHESIRDHIVKKNALEKRQNKKSICKKKTQGFF